MAMRRNDIDKHALLRRAITHGNSAGVPNNAKYSHTVWGISVDDNPIASVGGRCFIPRSPVPVYIRPNRLHF